MQICVYIFIHGREIAPYSTEKRSDLSKILNASESPKQDCPALDSEDEDLNALLLKAEKFLEEAVEWSWKVKAEEITQERAKEIMAWSRVIHKRAAEVGREMDALLDALKDIDPEVAKSYALLDAIKEIDPEVAKSYALLDAIKDIDP
ncbi:hypothetical protein CRG98_036642 [Punica granatum]|uniref:Uncharacterized protein n=2 Tax=Punica granatum TaxID=22663 RepID=A0A2I0IFR2_PUNGR|nr:hypothetical protein CRG98_036642 [Punica granatum]